MKEKLIHNPDQLIEYWKKEKLVLAAICFSGVFYNAGMLIGPVFQGKMIDALLDGADLGELIRLGIIYVLAILFIQLQRAVKRFYVRRFANNTSKTMRMILYSSLLHKNKKELQNEELGSLMTKVISDVDACVEGMRKFTTEIFDTGVLLVSYWIAMAVYDVKITLAASCFIPVAMLMAKQLKKLIYKYTSSYKSAIGNLSETTFDLVDNSLLYRVYGREEDNKAAYHKQLGEIEKKAVLANIWENAMQPVYQVIAMLGVIVVITSGGINVARGIWSVGVFSTYMSLFKILASKASRAAKLFNSVQKAAVSWGRIKPYMKPCESRSRNMYIDEVKESQSEIAAAKEERNALSLKHLSYGYEKDAPILENLNLELKAGEMMGVTGPVASGKSTLGRLFLGDEAYEGHIILNGRELSTYSDYGRSQVISYLGHQPQLLSDTIYNNITLGDEGDIDEVMELVCFKEDLKDMEKGIYTKVGNGGVRLSGGQQARIALARALYHKTPLIILDDPFSAVDRKTEDKMMQNLKDYKGVSMIMLISHRLSIFNQLDQVLVMKEDETYELGTHESLIADSETYRLLYHLQEGGRREDGSKEEKK